MDSFRNEMTSAADGVAPDRSRVCTAARLSPSKAKKGWKLGRPW
jgi:hypothetical protein